MGFSRNPFEAARKFGHLADQLTDAAHRGVLEAGAAVHAAVDQELARVAPTRRLRSGAQSGRSSGRAMSVRTEPLLGHPDNPAVLVRARGPWQIIERDTLPHPIFPKATARVVGRAVGALLAGQTSIRRPRSRRSKVLSFGGDAAAYVPHHPGTRGQHPFRRGATEAAPHTPRILRRHIAGALARIFR